MNVVERQTSPLARHGVGIADDVEMALLRLGRHAVAGPALAQPMTVVADDALDRIRLKEPAVMAGAATRRC